MVFGAFVLIKNGVTVNIDFKVPADFKTSILIAFYILSILVWEQISEAMEAPFMWNVICAKMLEDLELKMRVQLMLELRNYRKGSTKLRLGLKYF